MIRCYFGHHKCASTWIISILFDICAYTGLTIFEKQSNVVEDIKNELERRSPNFYISQTSVYKKLQAIPNYRGFHVIRDPRDIIVSGYFSHLYSHSTEGWESLARHREVLKSVSLEEGIYKEIEYSSYFLDHIRDWNYNDSNILELKMEDLVINPVDNIIEILKFLNLFEQVKNKFGIYYARRTYNRIARKTSVPMYKGKINNAIVGKICAKHHFTKLSGGRTVGQEDVTSHYRKGKAGDWQNYLTPAHLEVFYSKYPGLIESLGYPI